MGDDWYRNTTWSPEIAEQFQARLKRSRDKLQYLRIQASHLAEAYPDIALTLLEEYFAAGNDTLRAQAYVDQATAYMAMNRIEDALTALESALAREQEFPNVRTRAYLILPCLVAERRLHERYDQALEVLEAHSFQPTFPVDHYQWNGAKALILSELGNATEAGDAAKLALHAAYQTSSSFSRHRELGLVENVADDFGSRLKIIADSVTKKRGFWNFWRRLLNQSQFISLPEDAIYDSRLLRSSVS